MQMNTQNMSANRMAVKCKEGTRRESTSTTKAGASLFSSDSHKKYLPNYLRAHKSSCHDHCKYGIKYLPELGCKGSSLNSFGKEVKHKDTLGANNLDLHEARKRVGIKKTAITVDKPNVVKQKALPQIKETRLVREPIISKKINATGRQAIACMASKTEGNRDREMTKDVGNMMHESKIKGGSHAKEPASALKKAPTEGLNVLKNTPTKNSVIPYESHRFKQSSLVSSKIDSVAEPVKPAKGRTIMKTKGRSLLPMESSNRLKNEGYNTITTRGITRKVEERTGKPQVPSHSSKHHGINGSTSKPIVMVNPDVEDVEGKIACAIELQANSNSDGLQQRLLSSMNHELVSVTQTSLNLENDILDSPQDDSPKSECIDLPFLEPSFPDAEYFYLNRIQQESNNVTSSEYSAVYDEENEEENSAITELSESEIETEKTKTVSVTTKESDFRISELSEEEYETETISSSGTKTSMSKGRIEGAIVHPEENLSAPYMLRFRRSITHNSEIGDCDQVGREGLLELPNLEAVPTDLDPDMSQVALRHQVVHERKGIQGLVNIVLEETAIKLAENRKNKVQALVEAFETAISLQGKKLASTT
ncbi:hypothetical protein ZIOFF_048516 [Zingiber officinale]|uniref:Calmodulin-binding domain-containing protein n=2 Tax=Zingiber officinale TaxID=94328 RepID=A0A8J5FTF4_ZINOF|nr:hypothetical protein ZIOFF_048516 [Zingiber officinale]